MAMDLLLPRPAAGDACDPLLWASARRRRAYECQPGEPCPDHGNRAPAGRRGLNDCRFIAFTRRTVMTKWRRSTTILCLVFGVLAVATSSWAQTRPTIAEQLAKTYGLDSFGQVDAIRYTFDGEPINVKDEIDPAFYNDNYWLLLPLHVYWDASADVQDKGAQKLPLGNGSAKQVVVKYPSEGGFSPGDTWELYIGPDNRIAEFNFHRGGTMKPGIVIANWAGYQKAGPLLISTDHHGTADDKPLHI